MAYICSIRKQAESAGIAKIVPYVERAASPPPLAALTHLLARRNPHSYRRRLTLPRLGSPSLTHSLARSLGELQAGWVETELQA
jgi:hypothetical protein